MKDELHKIFHRFVGERRDIEPAFNKAIQALLIEARIDTISDMILECYDHDNPMEIAKELIQERQRLEEALTKGSMK